MWDKEAFGRRLKGLRHESDMTQAELERASGINERTIRYLERGQGTPSIETIYQLAGGLEVSAPQLLPKPAAEPG